MAFGVFIHRPDSVYEDIPSERYQFPKQYLSRARQFEGDWIVYLEPSKLPMSKGYFAIAKIAEIIPDPRLADMFLAVIEPGSYLDFGTPVAFRDDRGVAERGLLNDRGVLSGRAQAAVRPLSPSDFARIVERGLGPAEADGREAEAAPIAGLSEPRAAFEFPDSRERILQLTSRVVRERNFRRIVLRAYDDRCAVTGLKLINGGGRAEVEAAHILPVEENGPDIVSNGLALSRTAHWMFDRGLIGLRDDLGILVSRQANDPERIGAMINATGRLLPTRRADERPRAEFVRWHHAYRFKR